MYQANAAGHRLGREARLSNMRHTVTLRTYRLLLGFFAPPIFGSVMFLVFAIFAGSDAGPMSIDRMFDYFAQLHVIIFFAFLFVGAQSFVFSIVMEFVVRPRFPRLRYYLPMSCSLGLLSGLIPGVLVDDLHFFLPAGVLVGGIVGLLIHDESSEAERGSV